MSTHHGRNRFAKGDPPGVARDDRGEVFIEYLIVLGSIGIVAAYAFASLGPLVVDNYVNTRAALLSLNP